MPTLAKKEECTGCSACTNICPKKCLQIGIIVRFLYFTLQHMLRHLLFIMSLSYLL